MVTVTVQSVNDAPVMAPGSLVIDPAEVWFNQVFTLNGSLADVDPDDAHTVIITWAPGITETIDLPVGVYGFSAQHTYLVRGARDHLRHRLRCPCRRACHAGPHLNVQQTLYVTNLPMIKR